MKRTISRAISYEDRSEADSDSDSPSSETEGPPKKLALLTNSEDKFKSSEKHIKADAAKCESDGKLSEEEEIDDGKVGGANPRSQLFV